MHAPALLFLLLLLPRPAFAQEMRRIEPVPTHGSAILDAGQGSAAASMRAIAAEPDSGSSAVLPLMGAMIGGGVGLILANDCQRRSGCLSFPILQIVAGALLRAAVGFVIDLAVD